MSVTLTRRAFGAAAAVSFAAPFVGRLQAAEPLELRCSLDTAPSHPRNAACRDYLAKLETASGGVHAIALLVNRSHSRYAGRLPEDRIAAVIAEAHGPLGACATYLFNTVAHLEALGIGDRRLQRLRDRVAARIGEAGGS